MWKFNVQPLQRKAFMGDLVSVQPALLTYVTQMTVDVVLLRYRS